VGLAIRLKAEGNEVRIFIKESEAEDRGKGLVEHTDEPSWGETVVADCTGMGVLCDKLREHGAHVVYGSALADRLESDRTFSSEVMREAGIQIPEDQSFDDWDAAVEFIKQAEGKLVFKPEGRLSGVVPSYCPSDNEELLEAIDHFKALCGPSKPEFTLQQFIEGTCISTECFFDGQKFIRPFNHTIERKHFMNGDIGPSGGCTGNVVWFADDSDPIVKETVLKLEPFLREHDYRGSIDVNAVVNEEGVWGLEFTPRMGWDSLPTFLCSLYEGDFGSLLYSMARGEAPELMDVREGFGAGIRVSLPPWPTEKFAAEEDVPIRGLKEEDFITDFYPYEVKSEDGKLLTSGGCGIIGVMNASGDSVGEAFAHAYQKLAKVKIPDMQFRTDLAKVCQSDYRKLELLLTGRDAGWYGVDLDKTLAKGSPKKIGEPVPLMVDRVKRWVRDGKEVRIMTARANDTDELVKTYDWLRENLELPLEVTNEKDHEMVRLFDDRARQVEPNTGEIVA
jgi:phosphoribosylamine--glycine ligase